MDCMVFVARLILDSKTRRPKGFGFVTFMSEDDAHKAIKGLNGRVTTPSSDVRVLLCSFQLLKPLSVTFYLFY